MANGRLATPDERHLRMLFEVGATGTLTDGQLLGRFAARDGEAAELAFAALVERHGPMVLRVARAVLRDEHGAQDATQATFLILARKARSLWVRDSLGPWLHAVALRVAAQSRSAEIRRRRHERRAAAPESSLPPDRDRADLLRAIHEEIGRLPEPYRAAVVTCHLEGLTQHEAARRLGWPVGTLQSRLDRGRRRLRDRLGRRGLAPSLGTFAVGLPPARVPDALVASTARAAWALSGGGPVAGLIGPAVLAMIDASAKGMLMTKLKIGAAALFVAAGLLAIGSGLPTGLLAQAIDGPAPTAAPPDRPATAPPPAAATEPELVASPGPIPPEPPVAIAPEPRPAEPDATPLLPFATYPAPALLDFHATWAAPCRQMRPEIEKLFVFRYPVKSIDVDASKDLVRRYQVTAVPTVVLVDESGRELAHQQGSMTAAQLAAFYDAHRPRPTDPSKNPVVEPGPTEAANAKPWATVARIKVKLGPSEWAFGSGTVIWSRPNESHILTSASLFRIKGRAVPAAKDFKLPVAVDLFDRQLVGPNHAMVKAVQTEVAAEVMDYDFGRDLALLRIQPGRKLPASPVVPSRWKLNKGMQLVALGCSHGNDATAWATTLLDPDATITPRGGIDEPAYAAIAALRCANEPKEGRVGGGLYTTDGFLAGVCSRKDPEPHTGIYVGPRAIREFLDRCGLDEVFRDLTFEAIRPEPAPSLVPVDPQAEPGLTLPVVPRPWETVVRIRIPMTEKPWGFASGAVIRSTPGESIILTSAHGFEGSKVNRSVVGGYEGKILVDLFDGKLTARKPAQVTCSDHDLIGEIIECDFAADVALIRIRPGRTLPASRVVPDDWTPRDNMTMIALGCTHGNDATAWTTTILNPKISLLMASAPNRGDASLRGVGQQIELLECAHEPRSGRSGGGLYTIDGLVAGICNYADPNKHVGYYARPEAIRQLLDRNGLASVHRREAARTWTASESVVEVPTAEVAATENGPSHAAGGPPPSLPPEPAPAPLASDGERRLAEVERKLDRILKALEKSEPEKAPESPKGGSLLRR